MQYCSSLVWFSSLLMCSGAKAQPGSYGPCFLNKGWLAWWASLDDTFHIKQNSLSIFWISGPQFRHSAEDLSFHSYCVPEFCFFFLLLPDLQPLTPPPFLPHLYWLLVSVQLSLEIKTRFSIQRALLNATEFTLIILIVDLRYVAMWTSHHVTIATSQIAAHQSEDWTFFFSPHPLLLSLSLPRLGSFFC